MAGASETQASETQASETPSSKKLTQADLFPADRVLDVRIQLDPDDWDKLRHQSRNLIENLHEKRKDAPIESPFEYVQADVTIDGHRFPHVGVRKKGFLGSLSETRPSLKIKLDYRTLGDRDHDGEIDGLTNLTFNNNKQDLSPVSQTMGYALFNAAGSPAPRCAFASVTVNGKHLGVYSHVESMRRPLFEREFGADKKCGRGVLYEGTVVDFHPGWEGSFEHKFGNDKCGREKIEQLIEALEQCDSTNAEEKIGKLVDLDAFYKYWAIEGLLGFWDGYSANRNNF